MSAVLIPEATLVIDTPRRGSDATQLVRDPAIAPALRSAMAALAAAVQVSRT
jgi:hypothetical protein